jgi:hypothetical protein
MTKEELVMSLGFLGFNKDSYKFFVRIDSKYGYMSVKEEKNEFEWYIVKTSYGGTREVSMKIDDVVNFLSDHMNECL